MGTGERKSFPTRERGLKSEDEAAANRDIAVVPHAGTWIEIWIPDLPDNICLRRSPRGNVDWNFHTTSPLLIGICRSPRGKNQVQQEEIILILVWRRKIDTRYIWIILESHIKEDKLKARDGGKAVAIRWEYSKRFVLWHLKMSMMKRF